MHREQRRILLDAFSKAGCIEAGNFARTTGLDGSSRHSGRLLINLDEVIINLKMLHKTLEQLLLSDEISDKDLEYADDLLKDIQASVPDYAKHNFEPNIKQRIMRCNQPV